jgi:Glutaredoxin-like domain (DUF836)
VLQVFNPHTRKNLTVTNFFMHFQLFGTLGCHLCEQAEAIVLPRCHLQNHQVEIIDIAEHPEWLAKYATRIPVLRHPNSQQELGWPFDDTAVTAFITGLIHND